MLWFIIFCSIGIIIGAGLGWESDRGFGAAWGVIFGGLCGAVPALILNAVCMLFVGSHWHQDYAYPLQSMSSGDQIHGSFFLGSGYIDQDQVYNYFVKNPDGSFFRTWVKSAQATIRESSTEQPHIERWHQESNNAWLTVFRIHGEGSYTFVVPPNSVVQDFTLKP